MRFRLLCLRSSVLLLSLAASLACAASAFAQDDDGEETEKGPPPPSAMPPSVDGFAPANETEAEAMQTLEQFGRMWESEDLDTFDRIISSDADMVVIGTDATEFIVGYEAFRKARQQQFDAFENVEFNVNSRSMKLSESGTVAWFTEQFDLFTVAEGEPVSLENLRLSGVMERRGDQWKIVQLHTSVPVPGRAVEY